MGARSRESLSTQSTEANHNRRYWLSWGIVSGYFAGAPKIQATLVVGNASCWKPGYITGSLLLRHHRFPLSAHNNHSAPPACRYDTAQGSSSRACLKEEPRVLLRRNSPSKSANWPLTHLPSPKMPLAPKALPLWCFSTWVVHPPPTRLEASSVAFL